MRQGRRQLLVAELVVRDLVPESPATVLFSTTFRPLRDHFARVGPLFDLLCQHCPGPLWGLFEASFGATLCLSCTPFCPGPALHEANAVAPHTESHIDKVHGRTRTFG